MVGLAWPAGGLKWKRSENESKWFIIAVSIFRDNSKKFPVPQLNFLD